MIKLTRMLAVGLLMALSAVANATLITSNTITSPVVVDFSDQGSVSSSPGPIQIGGLILMDITVTPIIPGNALYTNFNGWGLISNGSWGSPQTYISSQSQAGMRFAFNDGPVIACRFAGSGWFGRYKAI